MKLDEHNIEHVALVAKYLANEMDENEKADFEIDLALVPENARLIEQMKLEWGMLKKNSMQKKIDPSSAWNRLSARLEKEQLIPGNEHKQTKNSNKWLLRVAASALIVVALGATLFWIKSERAQQPMLSVVNTNSENTVVETLVDGSIVYLANNTTLSYPEQFSAKERMVELKGQAYFDVAHNPEKPFIIETSDAYIQVLGTAFNVKSYSSADFELIVQRGKVKVTLKADKNISQIVVAGEKIVIDQNHLQKHKWVDDGSLSWRIGKMQFKDETLQNIVTVINRNYQSNIVIDDNTVAARRLTVTFDDSSLNTITELLCVALNLKENQEGDSIVLSSKDAH